MCARRADPDRRAEIALRAFEVMRSRGVAGTTMSDLAAALGMTRPKLYYWFADLGELFDAVLAEVLSRQTAYTLERLDPDAHPVDLVTAWMRATIDFYEQDAHLIAMLLQLWAAGRADRTATVLAQARARLEPLREMAVAHVAAAVIDGRIEPCNPSELLDMCVAIVDGCLVQRVSRGTDPRPTLEAFIVAVVAPLKLPARPAAATGSRPAFSA